MSTGVNTSNLAAIDKVAVDKIKQRAEVDKKRYREPKKFFCQFM